MKKESPVFLLIYGEGVHGDVGRWHTPADSSRLPDRSLSGIDDTFRVSEAEVPNGGGRVWLKGISSSAAECQRAFTLGGISPCSASVGESRRAVKLDRKSCSLP